MIETDFNEKIFKFYVILCLETIISAAVLVAVDSDGILEIVDETFQLQIVILKQLQLFV